MATFNAEGGVTLWPDGITPRLIKAIVDKPYERTDIPDGGQITGADRSFTACDTDVLNLTKRDAVQIEGEIFYVKELKPDGLGVTRVMLVRHQGGAAKEADERL